MSDKFFNLFVSGLPGPCVPKSLKQESVEDHASYSGFVD